MLEASYKSFFFGSLNCVVEILQKRDYLGSKDGSMSITNIEEYLGSINLLKEWLRWRVWNKNKFLINGFLHKVHSMCNL